MRRKTMTGTQRALPIAIPEAENGEATCTYDPLPSVWFGEDSELIDKMLNFYPRKKPVDILDATVNGGRFWRGLNWKIVGMDIDPAHNPDVVGDNTNMPFADASFDVVSTIRRISPTRARTAPRTSTRGSA